MNILRNFSIFTEKNKICLILKFPEISQRKLSNCSENDFPKVRKIEKDRKQLEYEQNPFQLGVRKNIAVFAIRPRGNAPRISEVCWTASLEATLVCRRRTKLHSKQTHVLWSSAAWAYSARAWTGIMPNAAICNIARRSPHSPRPQSRPKMIHRSAFRQKTTRMRRGENSKVYTKRIW